MMYCCSSPSLMMAFRFSSDKLHRKSSISYHNCPTVLAQGLRENVVDCGSMEEGDAIIMSDQFTSEQLNLIDLISPFFHWYNEGSDDCDDVTKAKKRSNLPDKRNQKEK